MSEKQYVIFKLGEEEYGVNIIHIQEISEYIKCTEVPNAPDFIEGIINYRGSIIPIINLHNKFNMDPIVITEDTRIIIFMLDDKQMGFLVDDASQIVAISDSNIESPPSIIVASGPKFISGIGKVQDNIIIILDLENLLSEKK